MEGTINDDLSESIEALRKIDVEIGDLKEKRGKALEKVAIEMKKVGKDYLRLQLDGQFWDVELMKAAEKLKFKRAKL